MIQIHGIRERKYQQYGELFLNVIKEFIASLQLNIQKENTTPYLNDIPKKSDSMIASTITDQLSNIEKVQNYQDQQKEIYPKAYTTWTSQEEQELKSLFIKGKNIDEISHALNRNPGGVKARLIRLGLWER